MPIIDPSQTVSEGFGAQLPEPVAAPSPRWTDLWTAAMQDNTAESISRFAGDAFEKSLNEPIQGYDPFQNIQGYEDYAANFVEAQSPGDVAIIKRRIDEERRSRDTLASGGAAGLSVALASGILDPVNLLPASIALKGLRGSKALVAAGETALAGGVAAAASEAVLQPTQETRTASETAINIAASTLLSGVMGAALGRVAEGSIPGSKSVGELQRAVTEELGLPGATGGSIGAKAARETTLEQEGVKSALGTEKLTQGNYVVGTPLSRTLASPSVEVRRIAGDLAETKSMQNKNAEGIPSLPSVEQRVRAWHGPLAEALGEVDRNFIKYRTGKEVPNAIDEGNAAAFWRSMRLGAGNVRDLFGTGGRLTYTQFRDEVGRAMRNGDEHAIPEVAAAAREMRRRLIDPLKEEAIAARLLPEDVHVSTAPSYFTRIYDTARIAARRHDFEGRITDWLGSIIESVDAKNTELQKTVDSARAAVEKYNPAIDPLKSAASESSAILKSATDAFAPVDRELKVRDKRLRALVAKKEAARTRLETIKPTERLDAEDPLVKTLQDIRRGVKEPERLAQFIHRIGGVKEDAGELKAMDATKLRPGLVNNKSGHSIDEATRKAWEAGYLISTDRPHPNEFLDALRSDLNGGAIYSERDFDIVHYREQVQAFAEELDRLGIDPHKMTNEQIAAKLAGEDAQKFVRDTPYTRARMREAEFNLRRIEKEIEKESGALRKVQEKWDNIKTKIDEHGAKTKSAKAELERLTRLVSENARRTERVSSMIEENRILAGLEPQDVRSLAAEITDKILGASPGRIQYGPIPLARGPLKERTLNIPDAMIEDYLNSDVEHVARVYARTMATDVELTKAFGRADMEEQIARINDSYAKLREGVTDEKQLRKLEERRKSDIADIQGMRDRIRGTYAIPDNPNSIVMRASRTLRQLNYLRLLGGMTISSASDAARPVMIHGLQRVMANGLAPLMSRSKLWKPAAKEVKLAGTALDMILDSRAMQLADIWDDYGRFSPLERGVQAMADRYGVVTAMAPWNAFWKQFAGVIGQTRNLQAISAIARGEAARPEIERLAFLGIGREQASRIADEFAKHGKKDSGIWWANTEAWTDREAADAFRHAIAKEVDLTIVTPGQDKPLWMSTELGKVIGQFRAFTMSSMTQVTQLGLQRRDAAFLQGVVLSVGLGMLSVYLRRVADGKGMPEDPAQWVADGVDRSGVLSWVSDANAMAEKVTRNNVGLAMLTGKPTASRYQSRNAVGALLGPSFGTASDAIELTGSLASGEWTSADTRKMRQLLPYQNLFYLRQLFNAGEEGVNSALGIPEKPKTVKIN